MSAPRTTEDVAREISRLLPNGLSGELARVVARIEDYVQQRLDAQREEIATAMLRLSKLTDISAERDLLVKMAETLAIRARGGRA